MLIALHVANDARDLDHPLDCEMEPSNHQGIVKLTKKLLHEHGRPDRIYVSPFTVAIDSYGSVLEGLGGMYYDDEDIPMIVDAKIGQHLSSKITPSELRDRTKEHGVSFDRSWDHFQERIENAYNDYIDEIADGSTIWIITHGDVIKQLAKITRVDMPSKIDYHNHLVYYHGDNKSSTQQPARRVAYQNAQQQVPTICVKCNHYPCKCSIKGSKSFSKTYSRSQTKSGCGRCGHRKCTCYNESVIGIDCNMCHYNPCRCPNTRKYQNKHNKSQNESSSSDDDGWITSAPKRKGKPSKRPRNNYTVRQISFSSTSSGEGDEILSETVTVDPLRRTIRETSDNWIDNI